MNSGSTLTHHAKTRIFQRRISTHHLELVLRFGNSINRQGFQFFFLTRELVKTFIQSRDQNYVKHLVVVVSGGMQSVIVTAYKNENALK